MSIRRVRGSFRSSQRRYGSQEGNRKQRSSSWVYHNDEWKLIYDKQNNFDKSHISHIYVGESANANTN
ncbi:hypothetical protein Pmani_037434 [Petrolisthes manimaculis]|uniref:Uncharacterized protein n=1 Tax=Petrolisthes manimaculis TaxID=1843537 RepID=A0AAE1NHP0_9EUCA|nr:hypothetical protein Pmani_037434 [Petrolisthes manimaculis]